MAPRRGQSENSIYYEHKTPCRDPDDHRRCTGSWRGVVSLGYGPDGMRIRRKVRGQTKTEVRDKLRDLHSDIEAGIRKPGAVTVQQAADDWLSHGLDGRSAATVRKNRDVLTPVLAVIGRKRLRELTAADVHAALASAAAERTTATVAVAHNCLTRRARCRLRNHRLAAGERWRRPGPGRTRGRGRHQRRVKIWRETGWPSSAWASNSPVMGLVECRQVVWLY